MIEVEHLSKNYRTSLFGGASTKALDDVSFSLNEGRIAGIIGSNGAGKSTLFKIMMGLVLPSNGMVTIQHKPAGSIPVKRNMGYLPEAFSLPQFFTANLTLTMVTEFHRIPSEESRERIESALHICGLEHVSKAEVKTYSKGMMQRLGLAAAIIGDPSILLLDEPLDGLDAEGRRIFKDILAGKRDDGRLILMSTHVLTDAEELCDDLLLFHKGKLILAGEKERLLPAGEYLITVGYQSNEAARELLIGGIAFQRCGEGYETKVSSEESKDRLLAFLQEQGVLIRSIQKRKDTLEDLYLSIIKK